MAVKEHEKHHRYVKAETIATAAEALNLRPDLLTKATERQWCDLAEIAQCNPPSQETRGLVVSLMRQRSRARTRIAAALPKSLLGEI